MDISHVVLVFLIVIILLVFSNGYMGEYMVAVVWIWTTTAQNYVWVIVFIPTPLRKPYSSFACLCVFRLLGVWPKLCNEIYIIKVSSVTEEVWWEALKAQVCLAWIETKKVLLHSTTGCFFSGFVSKSIVLDAQLLLGRVTPCASADRSYMVNGTGLRYI